MESWLLVFIASFLTSLALAWVAAKFFQKMTPILTVAVALPGLIAVITTVLVVQKDEFGFGALALAFGLCSSVMGTLFGVFIWSQFFRTKPARPMS